MTPSAADATAVRDAARDDGKLAAEVRQTQIFSY
jgi:hypothetical protein